MDVIFFYEESNRAAVYFKQELTKIVKEPELADLLQLTEIDLTANSEVQEKFSISSLPTIIFVKENQEINRINGYYPPDELRTKIKTILAANKG